jgi:hypothetical protein
MTSLVSTPLGDIVTMEDHNVEESVQHQNATRHDSAGVQQDLFVSYTRIE